MTHDPWPGLWGAPPCRRHSSWERRRAGGIHPGSAAVPVAFILGAPPCRWHSSWERRRAGGVLASQTAILLAFER